jgi:CHASE3 domain sensor protein
MQELLTKLLKKVSFVTTQPESDWKKIFLLLFILALCSFGWNVYFYYNIQDKIKESEVVQKARSGSVGARQDEVQEIINMYEKKKTLQSSLITNKSFRLEDPSVL